jgi:hypothetical protein
MKKYFLLTAIAAACAATAYVLFGVDREIAQSITDAFDDDWVLDIWG